MNKEAQVPADLRRVYLVCPTIVQVFLFLAKLNELFRKDRVFRAPQLFMCIYDIVH